MPANNSTKAGSGPVPDENGDVKVTLKMPGSVYRDVGRAAAEWRRRERVGSATAWIVRAIEEKLGRGEPAEAGAERLVVSGTEKHPAIYKDAAGRLTSPRKKSAEVVRENPATGEAVTVLVEEPASVLEHAARAEPGFGRSVTEHLMKSGVGGEVSEEPAGEIDFSQEVRPWLPELKKIRAMEDGGGEFEDLLAGRKPRFPKGFLNMKVEAQAKWLDEHCPLEVK